MYSGSTRCTCPRSSWLSAAPSRAPPPPPADHIPHQLLVPRPLPHHHQRVLHPPCVRSAASISPSSIRYPRSFTCWSTRPRNSSAPSPRHRARSPVRYIRAPGRPVRVRHEPLRRQPRPPQIPPRQPRPRQVQLPRHPHRHRLQAPVQHVGPGVPDRRADRWRAVPIRRPAGPGRDIDRRLGRPVQVVQRHARQPLKKLRLQRARQGLAATDHAAQARTGAAARVVQEGAEHRRHEMQRAHPVPHDGVHEILADPRAGPGRPPPAPRRPSAARRTPTRRHRSCTGSSAAPGPSPRARRPPASRGAGSPAPDGCSPRPWARPVDPEV